MTEEGVQMNEETQDTQPVQESTPQIQDESVDYKSLYLDEVQNAKKLRKRAQDAETTVQDVTKEKETAKVKTLKEQEKYKELYEETNGKLEHALKFQEKWETHESTRREHLLSKLPEEDRESLSQKDLDTLEYIVKLKDDAKPVNPQHSPNQSRGIKDVPDGNIFSLPQEERKKHWDAYMSNLAKKNN
jgi:hypothetical protein